MKKFWITVGEIVLSCGFMILALVAVIGEVVFKLDLNTSYWALMILQYLSWNLQELRSIKDLCVFCLYPSREDKKND